MPDSPSPTSQKILSKNLVEEMRTSYLDYSMSVLVGRALPDVRDGLKPVHRRVLFTMHQTGLLHSKPYRKAANVVGNCMARFHPHGDASIYDTLVRMAQDFSLRYPLVDGQGNFGSIDGDNAAAMRYTEARLARIAEELLADIEKETVPFAPNFDGSAQEPTVLPAAFPNLLVNGSSGIAVGMATNIPPHNLGEVIDALTHKLAHPEAGLGDILPFIKGPDFPTGGIIVGTAGIHDTYANGRGNMKVRARISREEVKDRTKLIVTQIPFQVNKSVLIEEMADLVRDKKLTGITDIRDESDRDGMRIVIELRRGEMPEIVENQLYAHTKLESSFSAALVALDKNQPTTLTLIGMLEAFIAHRTEMVRKRTQFDLTAAQKRLHILLGLLAALGKLDATISTIRKAKDVEAAKSALQTLLSLSDTQAQAILELRLSRLAALEQEKIKTEHAQTTALISELESILASPQKVNQIIVKELAALKSTYGDERRTQIIAAGDDEEILAEDLIKDEQMAVTVTHAGYVKRIALDTYRQQHRGGKGIMATDMREADFVEQLFVASTHDYLLVFTSDGMVHWLKVYQIPEGSRQSMGKAIVNLLSLDPTERISALIPIKTFSDTEYLVMATQQGTIKKTALPEYSRPRRGGIIAITLEEGDRLISVQRSSGSENIILASKNGRAVRFADTQIRPTGRGAKGVSGIKLGAGDLVVGMAVSLPTKNLLTITEQGTGKRSPIEDYRFTSRGSKGVINIKSGAVAAISATSDEDELLILSMQGQAIRVHAKDISLLGRNTKGVRIMRLDPGDKVVALALIAA